MPPLTPDDDRLQRFRLHAELCKVLTDPKRLLLLDTLRSGEQTVGELAASIGASLANTSQHLAVMRAAGLVEGHRDGTLVRYHLAEPAITAACDIVHGIVLRRLARRRPAPAIERPGTTVEVLS